MKIDLARQRIDIPGDPEKCHVYDLHFAFNTSNNTYLSIANACRGATIGCFECKEKAAATVAERFKEYKERRAQYEGKDSIIRDILMDGSSNARKIAGETLARVKEHLLFDY